MCIDAIEDLWRNNDDAKAPTTKVLTRWRPQIVAESKSASTPPLTNGTQQQHPDPRKDLSSSDAKHIPQGGVAADQAQGVDERKGSMPVAAAG